MVEISKLTQTSSFEALQLQGFLKRVSLNGTATLKSMFSQAEARHVCMWACLRRPSPPAIFSTLIDPSGKSSGFQKRFPCTSLAPPEGFKHELDQLLELLPIHIKRSLEEHPELPQLVEIVLDLGRYPVARFPSGDSRLAQDVLTTADLEQAISRVGDFADDNRAGIDRTLHRISAIRNRPGRIIGLTCRVGRSVSGSAEMARDLVEKGGSLLLMGPPGVGKTTAIREIARMLADEYNKRVIIVDTSNEIAGDGDIPHPGIGRARRMQVANVDMQHKSVTLGDDEARRRGVQKSVLERKGPPTFMSALEMISRTEWRIHHSLAATIDALLAGRIPLFEERHMNQSGGFDSKVSLESMNQPFDFKRGQSATSGADSSIEDDDDGSETDEEVLGSSTKSEQLWKPGDAPLLLYTYQISDSSLEQVVEVMGLDNAIQLTDDLGAADAVLALRSKLNLSSWVRGIAKYRQLPIFVIKANTMPQMVRALRTILGMESLGSSNSLSNKIKDDTKARSEGIGKGLSSSRKATLEDEVDALEEARLAIEQIVIPKGQPVELLPRSLEIIESQIKLIESYQLGTELAGLGNSSRIRILPYLLTGNTGILPAADTSIKSGDPNDIGPETLGTSGTSVSRLPILPE
ncbi:hypothetical protein KP509_34G074300 [Ceratopteris richardii]|uniref:AAA+ ATPase domain-containing protein n=1 Tax=Ceratopteris richardii TaxID=49495 RepID=A0A8T2QNH2_CERRI|nr:hypothetical protein KP509_34G074300 [Ceratopteris richardii]